MFPRNSFARALAGGAINSHKAQRCVFIFFRTHLWSPASAVVAAVVFLLLAEVVLLYSSTPGSCQSPFQAHSLTLPLPTHSSAFISPLLVPRFIRSHCALFGSHGCSTSVLPAPVGWELSVPAWNSVWFGFPQAILRLPWCIPHVCEDCFAPHSSLQQRD